MNTANKFEKIGDSLFLKEDYLNAAYKYTKAAIIYEKKRVWLQAVRNYRKTSFCFISVKKIDSSLYYNNISSSLFNKRIKDYNEQARLEESEIYYTKSRIFLEKGEYDSTLFYLAKGLDIINISNTESKNYALHIAKYYQTYGTVNFLKGDNETSLKYNFQALEIREKELDKSNNDLITSYFNIAYLYMAKRDYKKASQYFCHIINDCPAGDLSWKAKCFNFLGSIQQLTGEYDKAIEFFTEALKIYKGQEGENSLIVAATMNNLGRVYFIVEDFENAIKNLKASLDIRKKCLGEKHLSLSNNLLAFGQLNNQLGNYNEAIQLFSEALEVLNLNKSPDKLMKNQLNNLIGLSYLKQNNGNEAIHYMQKGLCELIDGFEYTHENTNPVLFFEGTNFMDTSLKIVSKPRLYDNLINKAKANFQIYKQNPIQIKNLKQSFKTYRLAFKLLDFVRLELSTDESKYILSNNEKVFYKDAIDICLKLDSIYPEMNYKDYIVELVDNCKNSSLKDKNFTNNALNSSGISDELITKERELSKTIAFYKTQLVKNTNNLSPQLVADYKYKYDKLSIEYDTICNHLKRTYPQYYKLIHSYELNIDEIKSKINFDEIIVEYLITDNRIFIITINNEDFEITPISIDKNFKDEVIKYYRSIRKVEISNYRESNACLYEKLIAPIKTRIKAKKSLIIIPDDYLFYIPFETLYSEKKGKAEFDFRDLNYLIKNFEIKYNYSLSLWNFNTETRKPDDIYSGIFLGFAPVFNNTGDSSLSINNQNGSFLRYCIVDGKRFSKLEYSEEEITSIANLFSNNNKESITFINKNATEDNFKKSLNKYKFIHISTHGFSNENNPDLSGLAFNNLKGSNGIEDGLLYSSEIKSLGLKADLIVLSACETGIGRLVKGEGLITIAKDFTNYGVSNIMYSLWNVIDKNTCDFMVDFYKGVLSGNTYSRSLQELKINMIQNINTSHPKIWGCFVLVGI